MTSLALKQAVYVQPCHWVMHLSMHFTCSVALMENKRWQNHSSVRVNISCPDVHARSVHMLFVG